MTPVHAALEIISGRSVRVRTGDIDEVKLEVRRRTHEIRLNTVIEDGGATMSGVRA